MDGMSYFFSKNGGYQFRSINPNMSELVKNDPRFALTRDYGFAFGMGANFAGALLKTVSIRWRYLTRGNTHAILTTKYNQYFKDVQGLVDGTTGHISNFFPAMRKDYNDLNKTTIPGWMVDFFNTQTVEDRATTQLSIKEPLQLQQADVDDLKMKGVGSVRVTLYVLRVQLKSETGPNRRVYYYEGSISSRPILHQTTSLEGSTPLTILPDVDVHLDGEITGSVEDCCGIFVLYEPLKRISSTYYTLQRLVQGYWYLPEAID